MLLLCCACVLYAGTLQRSLSTPGTLTEKSLGAPGTLTEKSLSAPDTPLMEPGQHDKQEGAITVSLRISKTDVSIVLGWMCFLIIAKLAWRIYWY